MASPRVIIYDKSGSLAVYSGQSKGLCQIVFSGFDTNMKSAPRNGELEKITENVLVDRALRLEPVLPTPMVPRGRRRRRRPNTAIISEAAHRAYANRLWAEEQEP